MVDGLSNDIAYQLKKDYYWLSDFNLSDEQLYHLHILIVRAMIGSDEFGGFYDKLQSLLGNSYDTNIIKAIANKIFVNRFIDNQEDIGEVDKWIKLWGLDLLQTEVKKSTESISDSTTEKELVNSPLQPQIKSIEKLKNYDWPNISSFERRALLEELDISSAEFKNWYDNNYGK